ncbi:MAG: hypothetical protein GF398_20720 [Chitinivibrionales bacterium]|nr:hypothetical protein [Chitinivibrionales bacterium]
MAVYVNGEEVDQNLVAAEAERLRTIYHPHDRLAHAAPDPSRYHPRLWQQALSDVIDRMLLHQGALRRNMHPSEKAVLEAVGVSQASYGGEEQFGRCMDAIPGHFLDFKENVARGVRVQMLVDKLTAKVSKPKQKEVAGFYKHNKQRFYQSEMVHVKHIVKNIDLPSREPGALNEIRQAGRALNTDAPFEQVAETYSDCKGNGGDLGYIKRGVMVADFDEVVFALEPGKPSGVFRSSFGYHIAKVYDHQPERYLTIDEAVEQIEAILINQKKQRVIANYVQTQRENACIEEK